MAFFGKPNAYVGLDIGTSSLKVVELLDRKKNVELSTYAEASVQNLLLNPPHGDVDAAIKQLKEVLKRMIDKAGVSTDAVVAALPNSIVFSTVITLPKIPDKDIDKAIHFAARDVVPADIDDMFMGWSRLGELPHMGEGEQPVATNGTTAAADKPGAKPASTQTTNVPIFITAAPKNIVERYQDLIAAADLELAALEVETFPLVRSLLTSETDSAMIIDIGDQSSTFHIVENGTPRLTHTIDFGGKDITQAIVEAASITQQEAEQQKFTHGITDGGPPEVRKVVASSIDTMLQQAQRLLELQQQSSSHPIRKTVLIGGGAKLKGLAEYWGEAVGHRTTVGNPWRGLTYPPALESRLKELGPTFGVAVGLAQRELQHVIREND